jgi:hypothetical protein
MYQRLPKSIIFNIVTILWSVTTDGFGIDDRIY